jgi:AraC family transcriptional regulator
MTLARPLHQRGREIVVLLPESVVVNQLAAASVASERPGRLPRALAFLPCTGARSFDCVRASSPIAVSDVMAFRHGMSALVQKATEVDLHIRLAGAPDHCLIVPQGFASVSGQVGGESLATSRWTPGHIVLLPAGATSEWCIRAPGASFIHLHVSPTRLLTLAESEPSLKARTRLLTAVNREDSVLTALAESIVREIRLQQAGSAILIESLFQSLCIQLLRAYCEDARIASRRPYVIAPFRLRRAQDFIEEHLEQHIGLEQIAAAAGLSAFHFTRCFKEATGLAPYRYVLLRRVERAKDLLENTSQTLAQIALACGFATQQHLTEIFRAHTGVPPGRYRQQQAQE